MTERPAGTRRNTAGALTALLLADGGPGQRQLAAWLPFVADLKPVGGRATAFVCRNHVCRLPVTDPQKLSRMLTENRQQGEPHDP